MNKKYNRKKGNWAEDVAVHYLQTHKGHKIIARNYLDRTGEIDIISTVNQLYVFTEVKYRTDIKHGSPGLAVNARKQQHIIKTAILFMQKRKIRNTSMRFDVVEVVGRQGGHIYIRHTEGAFTSNNYYY
ncbi:YraN family protein [Pseudoramibacter sp.]|jgi:putative endonuclease|uniref:YraN family protein n=1 Tax=Pseudoramibacter sp. TaxID=2034862 RepID=UPI0025E14361|nr:YraN family protein [Pseudoramibacter sp.]MCH4072802.1 YraN family protein [Pseudoramibacter sp.]MCH4106573.1 YraN family protein [Pseudoramibacter sp.]